MGLIAEMQEAEEKHRKEQYAIQELREKAPNKLAERIKEIEAGIGKNERLVILGVIRSCGDMGYWTEHPQKSPIENYLLVKKLADKYSELIEVCKELHAFAWEEVTCESCRELGETPRGSTREYEDIISLFFPLEWISGYERKNLWDMAVSLYTLLLKYKQVVGLFAEQQKRRLQAKDEAKALLNAFNEELNASHPSTSDTPEESLPEDDDLAYGKKQTKVGRATALYLLIKKMQEKGIVPNDNKIDGTDIGRFIAAIIGEDTTKDIRYTTAYRKVINKLDEVSNNAKSEAKEYLKFLKIDD